MICHFTAEELADHRAEFPGHWFVEVFGRRYIALLRIPATQENAQRVLRGSPGLTPDMLDGARVDRTHGPEAQCA